MFTPGSGAFQKLVCGRMRIGRWPHRAKVSMCMCSIYILQVDIGSTKFLKRFLFEPTRHGKEYTLDIHMRLKMGFVEHIVF